MEIQSGGARTCHKVSHNKNEPNKLNQSINKKKAIYTNYLNLKFVRMYENLLSIIYYFIKLMNHGQVADPETAITNFIC